MQNCKDGKNHSKVISNNNHLTLMLSKYEMDNQVKSICINNLKEQIIKQHIQIENTMKVNSNLFHKLKGMHLEIANLKKQKTWYREHLYLSKQENGNLKEKVYQQINTINLKSKEISSLNCELNNLRIIHENTQQNIISKKEKLFKKATNSNSANKNNGSTIFYNLTNSLSAMNLKLNRVTNNYCLIKISELQGQQKQTIVSELLEVNKELESKMQDLTKTHLNELRQLIDFKNEVSKLYSALAVDTGIDRLLPLHHKEFYSNNNNNIFCGIREINKINILMQQLNNELCLQKLLPEKTISIDRDFDKYYNIVKDTLSVYENKLNDFQHELSGIKVSIQNFSGENKQLQNNTHMNNVDRNNATIKDQLSMNKKYSEDISSFSVPNASEISSLLEMYSKCQNKCENDNMIDCNKCANLLLDSKIEMSIVDVNTVIRNKKMIYLLQKIEEFKLKVNFLNKRCLDNFDMLEKILSVISQKKMHEYIKELQVLLKVKDLTMKEKRKKYEANIRTLLKQVKQYMRERKSTEKKYSHLRSLYATLLNENNSLKVQIASCKSEIQNTNYKVNLIKDEYCKLQNINKKNALLSETEESRENHTISENLAFIERQNLEENDLTKDLQNSPNKDFGFFIENAKLLRISLQQKTDDLKILEESKIETDFFLPKNDNDDQVIISNIHLQALENELALTKADKNFLQRLCNDLRTALNSYIAYNKILKEQLKARDGESPKGRTIRLSNISSCIQFDDTYIKWLLKTYKDALNNKPIANIKPYMHLLKSEVLLLHEKVANIY